MNATNAIIDAIEHRLPLASLPHKEAWLLVSLSLLFILSAHYVWSYLRSIPLKQHLKRAGVNFINKTFSIESKIKKGLTTLRKAVHDAKFTTITPVYERLPKLTDDQIRARINEVLKVDTKREKVGRDGGNFYFSATDGHKEFIEDLASKFFYINIMHFDSCCGSMLIENELINFFGHLLHAPKEFVGTSTFGGSESLLMAMLTYRELGYKRGIKEPEIVLFESAHVAFFKAAFLFQIKLRVAQVSAESGEGNVDELMALVNENTVAIVLSGGTYAHGTIDPIPEVNKRIRDTDIWIHVDSCLGGFMSVCSSLKKDGRIPPIDFRLSRVGTISIDPHKYGESPKGCSILLYRNEDLKKLGIFVKSDWNGGLYATPSLPGSRGAASIVGAWISLVRQGVAGLLQTYDKLVDCREKLIADLESIPEIQIIGDCQNGIVSFTTTKKSKISVFDLAEFLKENQWHLSLMQKPYSFHITVSRNNADQLQYLKKDLIEAIKKVRAQPNKGKDSMYSVLYGSLVKLPDDRMIDDVLKTSIVEINRLKMMTEHST